jgi:anthranilate 1,2-dioxygenase small subunit
VKIPGYELQKLETGAARAARADIEDFHRLYCYTLDLGDLEQWPDFFTDDTFYVVTARENVEAGLPVGLIYSEGKAMIRDRAYAVKHTQMFAPRYLQHFVPDVLVVSVTRDEYRSISSYMVLQTLVEGPTTILQSGRYYDTFQRAGDRLLIKERRCVYDTTLIANDIVYPI